MRKDYKKKNNKIEERDTLLIFNRKAGIYLNFFQMSLL